MSLNKLLSLWLVPIAAAQISVNCAPWIAPAKCTSLAEKDSLGARGLACELLEDVLGLLNRLGEPATAFCSSYLHVPSVTTITGPTVTPAPITTDIDVTVISTVTVYQPQFQNRKRSDEPVYRAPVHDIEARAAPAALKNIAAAEISAACSCLKITPHSTSTLTITAPTPVITEFITTDIFQTITTCNPSGGYCPCDFHYCCDGACFCEEGDVIINTCL